MNKTFKFKIIKSPVVSSTFCSLRYRIIVHDSIALKRKKERNEKRRKIVKCSVSLPRSVEGVGSGKETKKDSRGDKSRAKRKQ